MPIASQVTPLQTLLSACGRASASQETNHVRVKETLGHPSSRNVCGDPTPSLPGAGHKERGTLRAYALRDLQFNQNPQMREHGYLALASPEIGHVMAGGGGGCGQSLCTVPP